MMNAQENELYEKIYSSLDYGNGHIDPQDLLNYFPKEKTSAFTCKSNSFDMTVEKLLYMLKTLPVKNIFVTFFASETLFNLNIIAGIFDKVQSRLNSDSIIMWNFVEEEDSNEVQLVTLWN